LTSATKRTAIHDDSLFPFCFVDSDFFFAT
jgi:hypothetical protein